MTTWKNLLNSARRKDRWKEREEKKEQQDSGELELEVRTEIERDYDRILFSTPVRRLADKTQVFPLEQNDSIRNRLTHSHEVSNLSKSIGTTLVFNHDIASEEDENSKRNIPSLLAAIGLAHDLGNPPFGHQGENAIQSWFEKNLGVLDDSLDDSQKQDFLKFEGNAQTIRILTRLQIINDNFGLNLTFGVLAALMKYPVPSNEVDEEKGVAYKKFGFFQSEKDIVAEVWQETGLDEGKRHALTYVMEACDDIAYSVLDAEDAVKKGIISFSDLMAYLRHYGGTDSVINEVLEKACKDHNDYRELDLSSSELNDISMQKFRVYAIHQMVIAVTAAFLEHKESLIKGGFDKELIEVSKAAEMRNLLKRFDKSHVYSNRSILEVELTGYKTINELMDIFWKTLQNMNREENGDLKINKEGNPKFSDPYSQYVLSRISENYRRVMLGTENKMPQRYKELQLMTDMISGMTDSYAISLLQDLKDYASS